jgi:hypothetical protein
MAAPCAVNDSIHSVGDRVMMLRLCLMFHRLEAFLRQRRVEVALIFEMRDRFWLRIRVALNFMHRDAGPAHARFEFIVSVAEPISRAMMIKIHRFRGEWGCTWVW